jgi:hypothetical protein
MIWLVAGFPCATVAWMFLPGRLPIPKFTMSPNWPMRQICGPYSDTRDSVFNSLPRIEENKMSSSLVYLICAILAAAAMVLFWRALLFILLIVILTLVVYGAAMARESLLTMPIHPGALLALA